MAILDTTYFDGDLLIAGLNDTSIMAALNAAIDQYEVEFLQKLLGPSLYEAFNTAINELTGADFSADFDPSDFDLGTMDERWQWLLEGHTYTYGGRQYAWQGMTNARKQSPLACYVYYFYRDDRNTHTTSISEVKSQSENASVVSAGRKMVKAWNKMVDLNKTLYGLLILSDTDDERYYPELDLLPPDGELYTKINDWGI